MLMTPERRHSERARIPCHIPVELTDAARAAQFEADAVDLSVGGLSLRASQLPDLGSQLFCTFEAMPGGAQILGRGEVVWRQPQGEQGGEFGLRFIEVDARNQALIDEMVAERIARIAPTPPEPVMATLEIENVAEPLTARLVHTRDNQALFEQTLSHFALGKAVIAHAGASLVRGHVAAVEVRTEGTVPRLLVSLELARDSARFGEYMWGEPGSDTDPDVFAQAEAAQAAQAASPAPQAEPSRDELVPPVLSEPHAADSRSGTLAGLGDALPAPILAREAPEAQQLALFRRDQSQSKRSTTPELGSLHLNAEDAPERSSQLLDDSCMDAQQAEQLLDDAPPHETYDDEEDSLEEVHAVSLAASRQYAVRESADDADAVSEDSALMHVLGVFAKLTVGLQHVRERARDWTAGLREHASARAAGGGRALFGAKPRRVTAVAQRDGLKGQQNLRVIVIGSLCILALLVFAYLLTPSGDEPIPHRDVRSEHVDPAQPVEDDTETSEASAIAASALDPQPTESPGAAITDKSATAHTPAASSERRAKGAGPAATAKAPAAPPSSMIYGQKQVPNARRFLLRMAEPVRTLLGTADSGGFSVVIMGNKSLDKAAPIAVGHAAVDYAAILNRRDHSAELTVRFAPGKSPAYRVSGQGSTLEVLIEQ